MDLALEMDAVFIEGSAAVLSAVIVFCGSVFFLLALLMGARLAYFITASVTLSFLLILGGIWSFSNEGSPLGPVGQLPEWELISVVAADEPLEGPQADAYPNDGDWREVNPDDPKELSQAAELGSAALDAIEKGIEEEKFPTNAVNNTANSDTVRLHGEGADLYGAVTLDPPKPTKDTPVGETPAPSIISLMKYDPGNPLFEARKVAVITLVLLILHLFVLSRLEKKARKPREAPA
ncbi:MAG TPA: hypothetical protein VEV82_01400 [Actinomycetota bacterium]|nr:hypothetical protein [Actinomycetota bacterium]